MPNAEIVAIGSELLLGQIVDTNSAWMAQRLSDLGVNLFFKTIVGDNPGRMKEVIGRALDRADLVITSGGLGPTQDDLTREVIAEVCGRRLVRDAGLLEQIDHRFRRRNMIMTPNNERQADIPEGAIPVENPNGTAPSFIVEHEKGIVYALPGVPHEMKWLFENEVVPYARRKFDLSETITYRVLKVTDMGESSVDDKIGHLIANSSNPTVGVLAHPGQVDVRITAKASSREEAMKLIAPVDAQVRELLTSHIFAVDDETMEDAVGALLREKDRSVAVFEDMTAGLVADRLQRASKEHFVEGMVAPGERGTRRLLAQSRRPERGRHPVGSTRAAHRGTGLEHPAAGRQRLRPGVARGGGAGRHRRQPGPWPDLYLAYRRHEVQHPHLQSRRPRRSGSYPHEPQRHLADPHGAAGGDVGSDRDSRKRSAASWMWVE